MLSHYHMAMGIGRKSLSWPPYWSSMGIWRIVAKIADWTTRSSWSKPKS